ncbi:MAG: sialidase family protein [Treponemataceae bacterium]
MRTSFFRSAIVATILFFIFQAVPLFALSDFYWESPAPFASGVARYPVSSFNGEVSAVAWQESERIEGDGIRVFLSIAVKRSGSEWLVHRKVAGPYVFSGSEPSMASIAVDAKGKILLAVSASPVSTEVLVSADYGKSFAQSSTISSEGEAASSGAVAPRIFVRADGGYLLFITRGTEQTLSLFSSRSEDGKSWTPFQHFVTEEGLRLNFLPSHASVGGKDFVVFQSLSATARPTFQLFLKSSADAGLTWTVARKITSFRDPFAQTVNPEVFDNQRAHMATVGTSLYLTWERRNGSQSPQVYVAELKENGDLQGEADRVTNAGSYCNNPLVFEYMKEPTVVWFDNRRGQNRVYLAQRSGVLWQDQDLLVHVLIPLLLGRRLTPTDCMCSGNRSSKARSASCFWNLIEERRHPFLSPRISFPQSGSGVIPHELLGQRPRILRGLPGIHSHGAWTPTLFPLRRKPLRFPY